MMPRIARIGLTVAAVMAAASLGLHADQAPTQTPRPPARDAVAQPTVGSATVSGTVVTDDAEHRPIYRALVSLTAGLIGVPHSTVTNESGQFVISGVPAGNYTLAATKPAFVPTFYGAKHAGTSGGRGVPLAVLDGQHLTGLDLRLAHGAAVTGTVRQADGRPAIGVDVQVTPMQMSNGQRQPSLDGQAQGSMTDDRGVFRVFGLAAGDYIVVARPAFVGLPNGSDPRQVTPAEVQWAEQATTPASGGALPGLGTAPPAGQTVAYAPVYFPGTADAASAAVVTIGVGEERAGMDFVVTPVPTATVSGQVFGIDGAPAPGAFVRLAPIDGDRGDIVGSIMGLLTMRPSNDGTFSVNSVKPGRYRLTARAAPPAPAGKPDPASMDPMQLMRAAIGGGGPDTATLWGQEDVTVDGRDIGGLSIRLQPGLTVSGKVVFETVTPPDVSQIRVTIGSTPAGGSPAEMVANLVGGQSANIEADGTFTLKGLTPDRYRVNVITGGMRSFIAMMQPDQAPDPTPGTIFMKSALWKGRDVADVPFDLQPGDEASGIVVTLTDRPTELSGTVRDGAGRPTPNFPIVVFSTDRATWFTGSRRIQQARVASDGKFRLIGLPAGEYYVAALTDLTSTELYQPAFLDTVTAASIKITLGDGEKKIQDLKLAGG